MAETRKYLLIIRYTDGNSQKLVFPSQTDHLKMIQRIEKLLTTPNLAFEVEGRLLIISTRHIRNVEIFPSPPKLPDTVIRNVHLVD